MRTQRLADAFPLALLCSLALYILVLYSLMLGWAPAAFGQEQPDPIAELQAAAAATNLSEWGHWGPQADRYSSWTTHSNRLIPVYSFGMGLDAVKGENSVYRDAEKLHAVYGFLPTNSLNPTAEYFDQTDVYRLQKMAIEAGKKRVILMVFDGMDWQTTWAAAIAKNRSVDYRDGKGTGLAFLDYEGAVSDYGYMVTSPHNDGTNVDVNDQRVTNPGGKTLGGYDASRGGETPWDAFPDDLYPITKNEVGDRHAYTDSSSSAVSMTCGIKTYNNGVNVDFRGREVVSIARDLQTEGFAIGVVTSVPISHATPAAAYASNVHRNDYQDLTRDMLGLPSVFHPGGLPGVDVLIGAGWGEASDKDGGQGDNFVPGNRYLAEPDRQTIDAAKGGAYVVAERTAGTPGAEVLDTAVQQAMSSGKRLFGYYGVTGGHLPYQTADGGYDPVASVGNPASAKAEVYTPGDINENVTLAQMTIAAADVLQSRSDRWWLMVEAGDVDWANHANNIDNSIGAVLSGELAFQRLTEWIESHGGWDDTCLILTADHGHYLVLDHPEALTGQ